MPSNLDLLHKILITAVVSMVIYITHDNVKNPPTPPKSTFVSTPYTTSDLTFPEFDTDNKYPIKVNGVWYENGHSIDRK